MVIEWWLHADCMMIVWWSCDDCMMIVWWLHNDCLMIVSNIIWSLLIHKWCYCAKYMLYKAIYPLRMNYIQFTRQASCSVTSSLFLPKKNGISIFHNNSWEQAKQVHLKFFLLLWDLGFWAYENCTSRVCVLSLGCVCYSISIDSSFVYDRVCSSSKNSLDSNSGALKQQKYFFNGTSSAFRICF